MRSLTFALMVSVFAGAASAQDKQPFTIDTMWAVERVGTPAVSPDGTLVAYTVTTYDVDENRGNADIWVVPLAGGTPRRLTTNPASDSGPAWSPDGKRLAFVSRREADKAAQIYLIDLGGGEPARLTEMPLGAGSVKWLPDGSRLVFVAHVIAGHESTEATAKAIEARDKNKVKARTTDSRLYRFWDRWLTDGEFPHLFVVDIATKKVTDLTPGSSRLFGLQDGSGDYDVSPDGSTIVFSALASPPPYKSINYDLFRDCARARMASSGSSASARIGSMTFSSAENSGRRKWNWNTNPSIDNRVSARSASSMCAVARPRMRTSPVVGRSRSPSR